MARIHKLVPTVPFPDSQTVMLGAGTGAANNYSQAELGKTVKLAGDSRYVLTAAGDEIEGTIVAVEQATQAGYTIGSVAKYESGEMFFATADGIQATPGTGAIAIGDYVVAGTQVAKDTARTVYPKVCKATAAGSALNHKFRVVSFFTGTGAVGDTLVIERV